MTSGAFAGVCGNYMEPEFIALIEDTPIVEASGLVQLRSRPDTWLTHNDAGGEPELYAISGAGVHTVTLPVNGADFVDWEDLAAGPCPDGNGACIYIGDIGDNDKERETISVYVVREPTELDTSLDTIATWEVSYPEGPANAEGLLVHPCTGVLSLITKTRDNPNPIFQFPPEPGRGVLSLVGSLDLDAIDAQSSRITSADWDFTGHRLVVQTKKEIMVWVSLGSETPWENPPEFHGPRPGDHQFEAITFGQDGDILSLSEGETAAFVRWGCDAPQPHTGCTELAAPAGPRQPENNPQPTAADVQQPGTCGCQFQAMLCFPFIGLVFRRERPDLKQTSRTIGPSHRGNPGKATPLTKNSPHKNWQ